MRAFVAFVCFHVPVTQPVVGIDPSSRKLAVVVLSSADQHAMHTAPLRRAPHGARDAFEWLSGIMDKYQPGLVVIEHPVIPYNRGAAIKSTVVQAYVNGACQAAVLHTLPGTDVVIAPPAAWKKETVGRGNADKPAIAEWLQREHPGLATTATGDQDLIDGACLALYGRALRDRALRLAQPSGVSGS